MREAAGVWGREGGGGGGDRRNFVCKIFSKSFAECNILRSRFRHEKKKFTSKLDDSV